MRHGGDVRQEAFEAVVYQGRTLDAVAQDLGVPLGTLKRWSSDGKESPDRRSWMQMREVVAADTVALKGQFVRLANKRLRAALRDDASPQDVYAAINAYRAVAGDADADESALKREEIALRREKIRMERGALEKAAAIAVRAAEKISGRSLTSDQVREIEDMYGLGARA